MIARFDSRVHAGEIFKLCGFAARPGGAVVFLVWTFCCVDAGNRGYYPPALHPASASGAIVDVYLREVH